MDTIAPRSHALILLRGAVGAAIGGAIGYAIYSWLWRQGFYGIMIPGALLGLGAGFASGGKSQTLALLCALAAIALAIVAEWLRAPFAKDQSLLYFVTHLHQLDRAGVKLIMMGLGAVFAWWFGQGR